ncbi:hypothetical protein LguiB_027932 [Lonicera macranthoides]
MPNQLALSIRPPTGGRSTSETTTKPLIIDRLSISLLRNPQAQVFYLKVQKVLQYFQDTLVQKGHEEKNENEPGSGLVPEVERRSERCFVDGNGILEALVESKRMWRCTISCGVGEATRTDDYEESMLECRIKKDVTHCQLPSTPKRVKAPPRKKKKKLRSSKVSPKQRNRRTLPKTVNLCSNDGEYVH